MRVQVPGMRRVYALGVALFVLTLCACGGGGGGGGAAIPGGGSAPTPVPTGAPVSGAAGDVREVSTWAPSPAIAYDGDHQMLYVAQGTSAIANGATVTLPVTDPGTFISALAYSTQAHALFFSSFTTIYRSAGGAAPVVVGSGFGEILGIAIDSSGNVYVIDGDHVASVVNGAPHVLTPPGTINISEIESWPPVPQIAFDTRDGALYVTDPFDTLVKRVTTAGAVTTIAGSCTPYLSGSGPAPDCDPSMRPGTGAAAHLGYPSGIAYDAGADLFYVSDAGDNIVWTMTPGGTTAIAAGYGAWGLHEGNGRAAMLITPVALALAGNGTLYIDQVNDVPFEESSTIGSYATRGSAPPAATFPALELGTPTVASEPSQLALAPDGTAWIGETVYNLAHVTPSGIVEYPLPSGYISPWRVTVDASGAAWTTMATWPGTIPAAVRVTPDGTTNAYTFPATPPEVAAISGLATGSDGNPWFGWSAMSANAGAASVTSIDRNTGVASQHPVNVDARTLGAGPDGNIWFSTVSGSLQTLYRMAPNGTLLGAPIALSHAPVALAPNAADASEWYVDGNSVLGRVDLSGTETTTTGLYDPTSVAAAPDGSVWFGETNPGQIARRDTQGNLRRYLLPTTTPTGIAVRSDGKVWVSTSSGFVYLFDAAAYDAYGLPDPTANESARRAPARFDRRTLFSRGPFGVRRAATPRRPTSSVRRS